MSFNEINKNKIIESLSKPETAAQGVFDSFKGQLSELCDALIIDESEENWKTLFDFVKLDNCLPKEQKRIPMMRLQSAYTDFSTGTETQLASISPTPTSSEKTTFSTIAQMNFSANPQEDEELLANQEASRQIVHLASDPFALFKVRFFQNAEINTIPQHAYAIKQWLNS